MSGIAIPPETRRRQRLATDPRSSCFVSANAGSGKTWVLSRRVIRLLLDGVDPGRILCLTFTKAAAAEMANRVFEVLGAWTVAADADLAAEIEALEGSVPDARKLALARRLFAAALETPGGLKVQTIHAFCEALLQRFPVEAGLPGRFSVLDDPGTALLLAEAQAETLRHAARDGDGPLGRAFALLLTDCTDAALDAALRAVVAQRRALAAWIDAAGGDLEVALARLPGDLGVPPGATADGLAAEVLASPHVDGAVIDRLLPVLDGASSKMVELAEKLRSARHAAPDERQDRWRRIFLTDKGEPRSAGGITAAVETALPGTRARFEAEGHRLAALDLAIAGLRTAERTAAAVRLADRIIGHLEAAKARDGALDYDDLIERTARLLSRSDAAAWVQYKLDQGIDHVLVDEAQDTSPRQWDIVRALIEEFFAGSGARGGTARTVFVVGDEKQSIYSFQGAAPRLFGETRSLLKARVSAAGRPFHEIELDLSFRSTPDVVKAVDRIFADPASHRGLATSPGAPFHDTVRRAEPGLVEVWPEIAAKAGPEPARWEDPVDGVSSGSPDLILAQRIADTVAEWIRSGERLPATGRPIRAGDVLILVRKRGAFVEAVNRALKARAVPVAGADRLDVLGHIVAADLLAAARVALLPEDDLSLAALARSPLVGLSEDDLFELAAPRRGSLMTETEMRAADGWPPAVRLRDAVARWRSRADTQTPFAFFARLVAGDGGRAAFRARLGREADEVIDEFLRLALAFEERDVPSLETFLARVAGAAEEVKREVAEGRDEVRVMTVHGAKGLEAPVVFLVDPGSVPVSSRHDPVILPLGPQEGAPLAWVQSGLKPEAVERALLADRATRDEEYRRLLYVGLTRARDRLIVAGVRKEKARPEGRWHTLVAEALVGEAETVTGADGAVLCWRWRHAPARPAHPDRDEATPPDIAEPLPAFLRAPVTPDDHPLVVTPSTAAGSAGSPSKEAGTAAGMAAARRGRLVHRMLEVLPEVPAGERRDRAVAYLHRQAPDLDQGARSALAQAVLAVLEAPALAALFGPGGRAEVGLAGEIAGPAGLRVGVAGQVDRLVATETEILIVDFKTNRIVPDAVPEAYVAQLALYRRLLADLHPGRRVRAGILWTEAVRFDEVDGTCLDQALADILTALGNRRAAQGSESKLPG